MTYGLNWVMKMTDFVLVLLFLAYFAVVYWFFRSHPPRPDREDDVL